MAAASSSDRALLFEDLMIVPLLAVVAFLSPLSHGQAGWTEFLVAAAALAALLIVGRGGLNPFFALLARARTREVLTRSRSAEPRLAVRPQSRTDGAGR